MTELSQAEIEMLGNISRAMHAAAKELGVSYTEACRKAAFLFLQHWVGLKPKEFGLELHPDTTPPTGPGQTNSAESDAV